MVEVINNIVNLFIDDDTHIGLNFRFEVVKAIQEAPDVPFEGPADVGYSD